MAKRNLLLCFDAFGTLFRLKHPIERQYGDVARQLGLSGFSDDQLRASFRSAFRAESQAHPNYGKNSDMGATAWWTNVIHGTFQPLLPPARADLPPGLVPRLLQRFASSEGYTAASHLPELLRTLQQHSGRSANHVYERVVVGVITNSDDRVPGILSSFGLRVSPLRYSIHPENEAAEAPSAAGGPPYDIDFHCMSYDVGYEKPDSRIFRAAETLLPVALARRGDRTLGGGDSPKSEASAQMDSSWDKLYVGDEVRKDVVGAQNAGWYPVLLLDEVARQQDVPADLQYLDDCPPRQFGQLFSRDRVVGVYSIAALVSWLVKDHVPR